MINTLVKLPVFHSEQRKKRIDKNGETFSLKFLSEKKLIECPRERLV